MKSITLAIVAIAVLPACSDPLQPSLDDEAHVFAAPRTRVDDDTGVPGPDATEATGSASVVPAACHIALRFTSHLRPYPTSDSIGPHLAVGTFVDLEGAVGWGRDNDFIARVMVSSTGEVGYVTASAAQLRACQAARSAARTDPLVREEHRVMVDGVEETWQLRWRVAPLPTCNEAPLLDGCDCDPFRVGEMGPVELVRIRNGAVVDRLDRWPSQNDEVPDVFTDSLAVRRWLLVDEADDAPDAAALARAVESEAMLGGDIDHDGHATEFAMTAVGGVDVCGHTGASFVVGLSADDPHLHVFRRADDPTRVAWLPTQWDWMEVAHAAPHDVVTWRCGDHGYEGEEATRVAPERGRFRMIEGHFRVDDACQRTSGFVTGHDDE